MRRFDEAITAHEHARAIYQELGDPHSEGTAWNNLGNALVQVPRFDEAVTAYGQDIAICAELGDHYRQAQTLENLGALHAVLDDPGRARRARADAVDLFIAFRAEEAAARVRQRLTALDQ